MIDVDLNVSGLMVEREGEIEVENQATVDRLTDGPGEPEVLDFP